MKYLFLFLILFPLQSAFAESCGPYTTGPNVCTSSNMGLSIPNVGSEIGPNYGYDLNNSLSLIDSHNHAPGYGVQVPSAGININADLTFSGFNGTNFRATRFTPETISCGGADIGELFEHGVDLYYCDGGGNSIQITGSGSVVPPSVVQVPNGGTGATTLLGQGVLQGNGTSPVSAVPGVTYQGTQGLLLSKNSHGTLGVYYGQDVGGNGNVDFVIQNLDNGAIDFYTNSTYRGGFLNSGTFFTADAINIGGNTTGDSNLGTISSVTNSSYYVGSFSLTFAGPWTNQSVTVNYIWTGKLVTLQIPNLLGTSITGSASTIVSTTGIPSALRPNTASAGIVFLCASRDNGANINTPGSVSVGTNGIITYTKDIIGDDWTNGNNAGVYGVSLTYPNN